MISIHNVPGLLSVNDGRLFGKILRELAEMGYDAGWCVYGAVDVGAPHKRDRLCIVAYRNNAGLQVTRHESREQKVFSGNGAKHGCCTMGDATSWSMWNDCKNDREANREVNPLTSTGVCSTELGDTKCGRLSGKHRRRSVAELTVGRDRPTQPGMVSLFDGVSQRLADQRWPAGRGSAQYSWEPARTVKGMKYRAMMIKMLGNAVVPQWAAIVLAAIAEIEGYHGES